MSQDLRVTLETVTPLFLGGADPHGAPELRAASVRGALRYWFRALLGGVIGDQDLNALREAESAVFGSTASASPVVVRVEADDSFTTGNFRPLLHNPQKSFTFPAISPNSTIRLSLLPRPPFDGLPEPALSALAILLLLGGLGKRSRRGFGSFKVRDVDGNFLVRCSSYESAESFEEALSSALEQARSSVSQWSMKRGIASNSPANLPAFPVLHDAHAKVLFCRKQFPNWELAMKEFWGLLRSDDYRDNPVFGFARSQERQASPLHFRIVKTKQDYHILLTVFRVRFQNTRSDWSVMQKFLNHAESKWQGTWIFGGHQAW